VQSCESQLLRGAFDADVSVKDIPRYQAFLAAVLACRSDVRDFLFPSYHPHTEALGSSAQIRCVSFSCWRYRVASKSASKAARITQMLRRIVRNLWRQGIGSCVSELKRELSPWLEFGLIPANL